MLYMIRCHPMHPRNGALHGPNLPVRITLRCSGCTSIYLLIRRITADPRSIATFISPVRVPLERFCSPSIRWCGTGAFQEQGKCFFNGISCSIPTIVSHYFSLSLFSVYRLVLWGWVLRTDKVYSTLSQRSTADHL